MNPPLRRVGIVFAGGPAPGANAVIAVATSAFRRRGAAVIGILHGYAGLEMPRTTPLLREGRDYKVFEDRDLWGLRNSRGVVIGTGRSDPGADIRNRDDLLDPRKTARLASVYEALVELDLDALVSIGGDGTLRTANLLHEYQKSLPASSRRVRIVHVPKTIDNDYRGIDFTFGFFTAVGVISEELQNLRADAISTRSYFIVETMGRRAGWVAYGAAIAGEAHLVVALEDVAGELSQDDEIVDPTSGVTRIEKRLNLDALTERIVTVILKREEQGKHYGTVVLAEGLADVLPEELVRAHRDEQGNVSLGKLDIGRLMAARVSAWYAERTGRKKKITGLQLGYESRSSAPHAFDVLLGSQLGLGAYRALAEEQLDGHMVSVKGQLDLRYVPFSDLVDPVTLRTQVRFVDPASDYRRLAQELGTRLGDQGERLRPVPVPAELDAETTPDALRLASGNATFVLTRLGPGIVLLRATGRDAGQFGVAPFEWLEKEMGRHAALEVFVDTRGMSNATQEVSAAWSEWIKRHRAHLKCMSLLTASRYVNMTLEVAKLFSRTGELMRIYTDASAFAEAVGVSMGKPFLLDPPHHP